MVRILSFVVIAIALLWSPWFVSVGLAALYVWRWDGIELLLLAIAVDWFLSPEWPILSVLTGVVVIAVPYVRQALMLYN